MLACPVCKLIKSLIWAPHRLSHSLNIPQNELKSIYIDFIADFLEVSKFFSTATNRYNA